MDRGRENRSVDETNGWRRERGGNTSRDWRVNRTDAHSTTFLVRMPGPAAAMAAAMAAEVATTEAAARAGAAEHFNRPGSANRNEPPVTSVLNCYRAVDGARRTRSMRAQPLSRSRASRIFLKTRRTAPISAREADVVRDIEE